MRHRLLCLILCAGILLWVLPVVSASALMVETNAKAGILYEPVTGRVLVENNKDARLPMASTTKIMTTLLAIEHGDLDTPFLVGEEANVEGSSMGLKVGDTVTLRDLLYGMLLESGNDAANVAAVRVAGSVEAFAELMNQRAAQIGMTNTHFVTPSGLDDEQHYSTAYDMALLAAEALDNELFREICASTKKTLCFGNPPYERTLYGHNKLLTSYEGAIGVKTGYTKTARRCLVSAAERDGVLLIAVTLNCTDDWNVHRELLDYGFSKISMRAVPLTQGDFEVPVGGGQSPSVTARVMGDLYVPIMEGEEQELKVEIHLPHFLIGAVEKGRTVGYAKVIFHDKIITEFPIVTQDSVALSEEKPSLLTRFFRLFL